MERYFIQSISVEGFRGINNTGAPLVVEFDQSSVNSIYATNGTGKSSIFEAFQYALSGRVEHLDRLQSGDNREEYLSNLFHDTRKASIGLTLVRESDAALSEIIVSREPDGTRIVTSPTGDPDPDLLLEQLNQDFTLLDYRTFNRFIESSALERGRSFSPLIGLSEYATARNNFEKAAHPRRIDTAFELKALESSVASLKQDLDAFHTALMTHAATLFGDSEPQPELDTLRESVTNGIGSYLPPECSVPKTADGSIDFDAITDLLRQYENQTLRATIEDTLGSMRRIETAQLKGSDWKSNSKQLLLLIGDVDKLSSAEQHIELLDVFEAGSAYFDSDWKPDDKVCPLCGACHENSIVAAIAEKTQQLSDLQAATEALRLSATNGALLSHINSLESFEYPEDSFSDTTQASGHADESKQAEGTTKQPRVRRSDDVTRSINSLGEGTPNSDDIRILSEYASLLDDEIGRIHSDLSSRVAEYREQLPPSMVDQFEAIRLSRTIIEQLDQYVRERMRFRHLDLKLRTLNSWKDFMRSAERKFSELEAAQSSNVLTSLKSDYQKLFSCIAPDRGIVPALERDSRKENLALKLSTFHTASDVTAQAVLSESYRNSLAISIFLSAAMRQSRAPRFIVLDDVTSSFDAGTQFALLDTIRSQLQYPANPDGMQFILLSHETSLEKFFNKVSAETDWKHQKLHGIPPFVPLSVSQYTSTAFRDSARTRIQSGDIDGGAGLIRQHFESQLLEVISKLKIRVPMDISTSDHRRMVGDLLNAILAEVDLHAKAGTISLTPQQQRDISSRHVPALLANWVSHYSGGGAGAFMPAVLLGVLDSIDDFVDCFKHDGRNGIRVFYKSLKNA